MKLPLSMKFVNVSILAVSSALFLAVPAPAQTTSAGTVHARQTTAANNGAAGNTAGYGSTAAENNGANPAGTMNSPAAENGTITGTNGTATVPAVGPNGYVNNPNYSYGGYNHGSGYGLWGLVGLIGLFGFFRGGGTRTGVR